VATFSGNVNLFSGSIFADAGYGDGIDSASDIEVLFHLSGFYSVVGGKGPLLINDVGVGTLGNGFDSTCVLTVNGVSDICNLWSLNGNNVMVEFGSPFAITIDGTFFVSSSEDPFGGFDYDLRTVMTSVGDRRLMIVPEPVSAFMLGPGAALLVSLTLIERRGHRPS
jgi:hypothetical protein